MLNTIIIVFLISFLLALRSVLLEKRNNEWQKVVAKYHKDRIKGGIVIEKGKKAKHYSSYSR